MIEELVKKRAYEIYIHRTQSLIWDFGRLGTEKGDYYQAEREIRAETKSSFTPK